MDRPDRRLNIPTEILRTVATVAETRSFTRAGERLGLSQPGISAQIKKLQTMIGAPVFERTTGGVTLTGTGELLLPLVRAVLASNDQILQLGGSSKADRPVRLGISDLFADPLLRGLPNEALRGLHIHCDHTDEIAKRLADGYLDIGCLVQPHADIGRLIARWAEDLVWVRSKHFVLSPGDPIPVIAWPGHIYDQVAIAALREADVAFRIVFASSDHASRLSAVFAGLGVSALPRRSLVAPALVAKEYYLPALPPLTAGLCLRKGFDASKAGALMRVLGGLGRADVSVCGIRCDGAVLVNS